MQNMVGLIMGKKRLHIIDQSQSSFVIKDYRR